MYAASQGQMQQYVNAGQLIIVIIVIIIIIELSFIAFLMKKNLAQNAY